MRKKILALAAVAALAASAATPAIAGDGNQKYCTDTDQQTKMAANKWFFWNWFYYGKCF